MCVYAQMKKFQMTVELIIPDYLCLNQFFIMGIIKQTSQIPLH